MEEQYTVCRICWISIKITNNEDFLEFSVMLTILHENFFILIGKLLFGGKN
jgi:hypothetical protein